MPPDRGMDVPNSSITKIPQVEIMAPITQHMSAIPTLPDSLKIVLGVENILFVILSQSPDINVF